MKKQGFTLAEVLVTLGIIGVVAAMTIPTLVNQTNDAEYKTGLKKVVSVLNQAVTMNYALDGVDFSELSTTNPLSTILKNRLNVINETSTDCSEGAADLPGTSCYALNDGMLVNFTDITTGCHGGNAACYIYVDINGTKKPNRLSTKVGDGDGHGTIGDRYILRIHDQSVVPADGAAEYIMYGKTTKNAGIAGGS